MVDDVAVNFSFESMSQLSLRRTLNGISLDAYDDVDILSLYKCHL